MAAPNVANVNLRKYSDPAICEWMCVCVRVLPGNTCGAAAFVHYYLRSSLLWLGLLEYPNPFEAAANGSASSGLIKEIFISKYL